MLLRYEHAEALSVLVSRLDKPVVNFVETVFVGHSGATLALYGRFFNTRAISGHVVDWRNRAE